MPERTLRLEHLPSITTILLRNDGDAAARVDEKDDRAKSESNPLTTAVS